jgi:hypothetical protein
MNGPFTCEQLRNIRSVAIDHEFNVYTNSIVETIKQRILDKAIGDVSAPGQVISKRYDSLPPTQYSVPIGNLSGYGRSNMVNLFNKKVIVDTVLAKLKTVFPDMKIIIDPLNTYILFDWS